MVSQVANLQVVVAPEISDKMSTRDVSVSELGTARSVNQGTSMQGGAQAVKYLWELDRLILLEGKSKTPRGHNIISTSS